MYIYVPEKVSFFQKSKKKKYVKDNFTDKKALVFFIFTSTSLF